MGAVTDMHELLRVEREKVAKLDKQVARLAREVKKTFDTRTDWWQHGVDRGWVEPGEEGSCVG